MDKEILNKFFEKALQYLNSIESFTGKNVPLFLEEIVRYKIVESMIYFIIAFIFFIAAISICAWVLKHREKDRECVLHFIYALPAAAISFIGLTGNLSTILKCWFAPRLFLVEYLKGLIQ